MKFFNYTRNGSVRIGISDGQKRVDLFDAAQKCGFEPPCCMEALISEYALYKQKIEAALKSAPAISEHIRFAPAVTRPQKILCVGLNYENHIGEMKRKKLEVPTIFGKYQNALSAHGEEIALPYPDGNYDYEAELVVVMGKKCKNVTPEAAKEYIFGYTAGNDLSVREVQNSTSQWLLGKSFDKFAPVGPEIVTADSIDASSLSIKSFVNGEVRQNASTSCMIFSCEEIISHISRYMTLLPGDIIFTGTPGGVILGYPEDERVWLCSGDRVDVEIEGIGVLTTFFKFDIGKE